MMARTQDEDEELTDCVGYEAGEKDSTTLHDSNRNERREHSVVAIMVACQTTSCSLTDGSDIGAA
jgi:hypothetical protein